MKSCCKKCKTSASPEAVARDFLPTSEGTQARPPPEAPGLRVWELSQSQYHVQSISDAQALSHSLLDLINTREGTFGNIRVTCIDNI